MGYKRGKKNKKEPSVWMVLLVAEKVGFEPTWRVTANSISSRARYDHFDTSPYSIGLSLTAYSFYHGIVYLTSPFGKNFLTCEIGIEYLTCLCNGLSIGAPDFKLTDSGQSHRNAFTAVGHLAVQRALTRHVESVCAGQR